MDEVQPDCDEVQKEKEKKPGMSSTQDGTGGSNEVGSNKLYLGRRLLQAVAGCPVALVDERTHIGFLILFVFVQDILFLYRLTRTYRISRYLQLGRIRPLEVPCLLFPLFLLIDGKYYKLRVPYLTVPKVYNRQ